MAHLTDADADFFASLAWLDLRGYLESWSPVAEVDGRMVVHLINLVGQADAEWDAERKTPVVVAHGMLRVRRVRSNPPRVRVADPDHQSHLVELETRTDGDHVTALLPPLNVWQMVVIDF